MKRVKSYHEKIRPQKARYTTTICERTRCPDFTAIVSPKYAGICVTVSSGAACLRAPHRQAGTQTFIIPGLRKCLLKRRKATEKQDPCKRVEEALNGARD